MHLHSSEKMDFNAMAPLHIMHYNNPDLEKREDWDLFSIQLEDCKKIGIDAISVDVWWGLVETSDNQFYWSYYFKVFKKIPNEKNNSNKLILIGSILLIIFQVLIHVGVNIRLLPTTGMTLPFLSYGGSSLLSCSILAGLILNFTKRKI